VLQRRSGKVSFFTNCAQQSIGIYGAKFPHWKFADAFAQIVAPDFVVALASAGSMLLFGPRQVSSLHEGGQGYPRVPVEPIAIDGLHELCPALFDFSNIEEVLATAQMLGGVNNVAGLVLLAVPHEPRTMVFVQIAMLITEIFFRR